MDLMSPEQEQATTVGTVGVLVCTHLAERLPLLRRAVASLAAQTRPPDEVLVMVDGTEDLAAVVREALPDVRITAMGRNTGVSVARNEGATRLDTDWVVFMDDDAHAEAEWLERLISPLGTEGVLGASGRSLPIYEVPRPRWLPEEYLWAFGCSFKGLPETTSRARNFYGGASIVRRRLFLDLGGFSPELGHSGGFVGGGEEAHFCQLATRETGGWFVYEPAAIAHHLLPASRLTLRYLVRRCYGEGVMKQRLARSGPGAQLAEERAFALRLPLVALGYLLRGQPSRAVGLAIASVAVVAGMVRGRLHGTRRLRP